MLLLSFGINMLKDVTRFFFLDLHLSGFGLLKKILTFRVLGFLRFSGSSTVFYIMREKLVFGDKG